MSYFVSLFDHLLAHPVIGLGCLPDAHLSAKNKDCRNDGREKQAPPAIEITTKPCSENDDDTGNNIAAQ